MAIKARYKGNGEEFHMGIPKRDLTEEEYDALDADEKKLLRSSPIYDVRTEAEMHPSKNVDKPEGDNK